MVFFKLDYEIIGVNPKSRQPQQDELEICCSSPTITPEVTSENNETLEKLHVSIYSKQSKASHCSELLNQLKSLTYLVKDLKSLEILEDQLVSSLKQISDKVEVDNGLIIETVKRSTGAHKRDIKYEELKYPKKKKSKLSRACRNWI